MRRACINAGGSFAARARRISAAPIYATGSRAWPIATTVAPVSGPPLPSATSRKHRLNMKHPNAERNISHATALYVRMRLTIEVIIASPYSSQCGMDEHSCSLKEYMRAKPWSEGTATVWKRMTRVGFKIEIC